MDWKNNFKRKPIPIMVDNPLLTEYPPTLVCWCGGGQTKKLAMECCQPLTPKLCPSDKVSKIKEYIAFVIEGGHNKAVARKQDSPTTLMDAQEPSNLKTQDIEFQSGVSLPTSAENE